MYYRTFNVFQSSNASCTKGFYEQLLKGKTCCLGLTVCVETSFCLSIHLAYLMFSGDTRLSAAGWKLFALKQTKYLYPVKQSLTF